MLLLLSNACPTVGVQRGAARAVLSQPLHDPHASQQWGARSSVPGATAHYGAITALLAMVWATISLHMHALFMIVFCVLFLSIPSTVFHGTTS